MELEKQPSSRTCFLCGRENPMSLNMAWYNDPEYGHVISHVSVPEPFNGYPGIVHGGIVAAMLDETAGRAIMVEGPSDNFMVTMKLEVTYHRPTPTETPLSVIGRVVRKSSSRARVEGEIRLSDGTVTSRCSAVLAKPPDEMLGDWEQERKHWYVNPD